MERIVCQRRCEESDIHDFGQAFTPLENRLRRAGGQSEYTGSFLGHYVARTVDPARWERSEPWLGAFVLLVNVAAYALLLGKLGDV